MIQYLQSVTSSSDNVYITWLNSFNPGNAEFADDLDIFFSKSTDGGKTFNEPMAIFRPYSGLQEVEIAASGHNILITSDDTSRIMIFRSTDGGKTFEYDNVNSGKRTPGQSSFSDIGMSGNATAFIAWHDNSNHTDINNIPVYQILFTSSIVGGQTFSKPVNVSSSNEDSFFPKLSVP